MRLILFLVFFKQKTAYEMRISDWSSDVCSSDLKEERPFDKLRANGFDLSLWLCASQKKANRSNRPIIGYQRLRKACAGFADSSGQPPAIPIRNDKPAPPRRVNPTISGSGSKSNSNNCVTTYPAHTRPRPTTSSARPPEHTATSMTRKNHRPHP